MRDHTPTPFARILVAAAALALAACGKQPAPGSTSPQPGSPGGPAVAAPETVTVRDPDTERENARLRVALLERSTQLAESDRKLDEATTEVVRAMARLRSLATRAEAASAMAEAEVTLQQLRGPAGSAAPPEARQAEEMLRLGSAAFDAENYGGAVYLATQSKRVATAGRGRLAEGGANARPGERNFALPVPLTTTGRANLRSSPASSADVVAAVPAATALTAYAYVAGWIRVTTADGRSAWVQSNLVRGTAPGGP
jgi:hypothetical protein